MSTYPRLEARVKALENRQTNTETHIEEVTGDIGTSIQQLSIHMEANFKDIEASFKEIDEHLVKTEKNTEERFNKIEATMATKEDLAAMESRILDAFKQLIATIKPQ